MELKSQMLDSHNDVLRTNKLERITKMIISLNKLDNSDNLEDARPSNVLFTYYVTSSECYPHINCRAAALLQKSCTKTAKFFNI